MILKKNIYTLQVVANCCRTPKPKYHLHMFLINLYQDVRKCCPNNSNKKLFNLLKLATWWCILWFFKAKNKEKLKKIFVLLLFRSKTVKAVYFVLHSFVCPLCYTRWGCQSFFSSAHAQWRPRQARVGGMSQCRMKTQETLVTLRLILTHL